jgi:hypothetical protein
MGEGESEAEKAGLIILQALDKIEVKALPMDLPEAIEISTVELKEAGEKVTLADAKLPDGVEFVEHDSGHGDETEEEKSHVTDLMVASVWEPAALQAANEATAGDATDESEVEAENGEDTDQNSQAPEDMLKICRVARSKTSQSRATLTLRRTINRIVQKKEARMGLFFCAYHYCSMNPPLWCDQSWAYVPPLARSSA